MNESRRADFNKLIDYIQKEYRQNLNGKDYEILQTIATKYPAEEIKQALDYCKSKNTDSLIYLQSALSQKYYQSEKNINTPLWLNEKPEKIPLDEKEKKWARNFYKKYCDTEEEYQERVKKV